MLCNFLITSRIEDNFKILYTLIEIDQKLKTIFSKKLLKNKAIIKGNSNFEGAELMSSDLRASVALVLAAIVAKGSSIINRIYHLDRGYENIENKLRKVGVKIRRVS